MYCVCKGVEKIYKKLFSPVSPSHELAEFPYWSHGEDFKGKQKHSSDIEIVAILS